MSQDLPTLRRQLAQLKELHEQGVLPEASFEESKGALERKIVEVVMAGGSDVASGEQPAAQPASQAAPVAEPTSKGVSNRMLFALGAGVVALAAAGYWKFGSPDQMAGGATLSSGTIQQGAGMQGGADATAAPHATGQTEIAGMADKLAERMKTTPEDAEGWAMLARSYTVLGRHPEALVAYEKAVKLRQDDAPLLADYADSIAVKNGGNLAGEPMKWIEAALKLDPKTPKALALAGTHAFDQKNYKEAVKYWEQVVQYGPPDTAYVQQVRSGIDEARRLGGLPAPAMSAAPAPSDASTAAPMALPGKAVSGTVTLASALAGLASPEDTVFIYARAAEGGQRMPLAIQRLQVKDLPFKFSLDDSSSMSPAARISGVKSVIVSARVTKSGQAMPAPGDLTGQSAPVAVGESGLAIEIKEQVK